MCPCRQGRCLASTPSPPLAARVPSPCCDPHGVGMVEWSDPVGEIGPGLVHPDLGKEPALSGSTWSLQLDSPKVYRSVLSLIQESASGTPRTSNSTSCGSRWPCMTCSHHTSWEAWSLGSWGHLLQSCRLQLSPPQPSLRCSGCFPGT